MGNVLCLVVMFFVCCILNYVCDNSISSTMRVDSYGNIFTISYYLLMHSSCISCV